ncbi:hypothetical protein CPB86DRAFT_500390 [Serendipita vermifera]|nr:hypothetical protein CPB86DRAFT_500390 [Serendipita vermifera]
MPTILDCLTNSGTRFTTTTRRGFEESVITNSPNVDNHNESMFSTQLLDSITPVPFITVPQTLPGAPLSTPTPTSMRIATPIASRTTINVPNVISAPITNNYPSPMTNASQHSGANNSTNTMESTVQQSVAATEAAPQV